MASSHRLGLQHVHNGFRVPCRFIGSFFVWILGQGQPIRGS